MREKLFNFTKVAWSVAKNPAGSAVIGGVSGSTAAHLFSKSKRVQELEQAQSDCAKLEARISTLDELNKDLLIRNDKLRDELRLTDRESSKIRTQLSDYRHFTHAITTAHKNSWCFWRHSVDHHSVSHKNTQPNPVESPTKSNLK